MRSSYPCQLLLHYPRVLRCPPSCPIWTTPSAVYNTNTPLACCAPFAMASSLRATSALKSPCTTRARPSARTLFTAPCQQRQICKPVKAIEIDWSDPDTLVSVSGIVLGCIAGLGAPIWYISRVEKDEERLEELRAMNRATFAETGEYMSDEEIAKVRKPKWTDRREWQDDD